MGSDSSDSLSESESDYGVDGYMFEPTQADDTQYVDDDTAGHISRTVKEIKSTPDVLVAFLTASEVWARKRRGLWPRLFQIRPHLLLKRP